MPHSVEQSPSKTQLPSAQILRRGALSVAFGFGLTWLSSCGAGSQERDDGTPGGGAAALPADSDTSAGSSTVAAMMATSTGAAAGTGIAPGAGTAAGTAATAAETEPTVESLLGGAVMGGSGSTMDRYGSADVTRNGMNYKFIANGWGPGWLSHDIDYAGTSFTINNLEGMQGNNYEPASFPATLCGQYSVNSMACGLPAAIDSLDALPTGWRWDAGSNAGEYNASYDIWLGDGTSFRSFLMVWLRDPPRQQPVGGIADSGGTLPGVSGLWNVWVGTHLNSPIVSYVYKGNDLSELEFDVIDVIEHTRAEGYDLPGTHVLSVAVGFEIWNGPINNLKSSDFYVFP